MSEEPKPDQPDPSFLRSLLLASHQQAHTLYVEHRRSLRTWFLAYAVGGPVILVSNEGARAIVLSSIWFAVAVISFFLVIVIQILGAIYDKHSWEAVYRWMMKTQTNPKALEKSPVSHLPRLFAWFNTYCADFVTFGLLIVATAIIVFVLGTHDPAASPVPTTLPVPCSYRCHLLDTLDRADGAPAVVELDLDVVRPATAPGIDDPAPPAGDD